VWPKTPGRRRVVIFNKSPSRPYFLVTVPFKIVPISYNNVLAKFLRFPIVCHQTIVWSPYICSKNNLKLYTFTKFLWEKKWFKKKQFFAHTHLQSVPKAYYLKKYFRASKTVFRKRISFLTPKNPITAL